jgi:hypothetical protein
MARTRKTRQLVAAAVLVACWTVTLAWPRGLTASVPVRGRAAINLADPAPPMDIKLHVEIERPPNASPYYFGLTVRITNRSKHPVLLYEPIPHQTLYARFTDARHKQVRVDNRVTHYFAPDLRKFLTVPKGATLTRRFTPSTNWYVPVTKRPKVVRFVYDTEFIVSLEEEKDRTLKQWRGTVQSDTIVLKMKKQGAQ